VIKSISQWAFAPDRSINEMFDLAKQHGFDGIELAVAEDGVVPLAITQAECQSIVSQASNAGIRLAGLASGMGWKYPITSMDAATRGRGIDVIARSLEIGRWLDIDALLVVPGRVGPDGLQVTPYDTAYTNAASAIAELAPIAERHRVSLGIENVWNMLLLSPLEMRDFIDNAHSPFVGSYFDVGNVIVTGYAEHWIKILGSRIKRVHIKDFKRSAGHLDGFCPLLEGDADYPAVMQALREVGYDGPITAEFGDAEDQLAAISGSMDKILSM